VAAKIHVERSDLAFEAGYPEPEFDLFRDGSALLSHLYKRLQPHGLKLSDLRVERGSGNVAETHLLCYLFDYLMTVRLRVERIEINWTAIPNPEQTEKFKAATVEVLKAIRDLKPDFVYRAFAVAVGMHARLEGQSARDYLAQFGTKAPVRLGPPTGEGHVFYYGSEADRLLSVITVDMSALVPDGIFVKIHALWDAGKVSPESLSTGIAEGFIQQALENLGLQLA
jgi:hypothetical protein